MTRSRFWSASVQHADVFTGKPEPLGARRRVDFKPSHQQLLALRRLLPQDAPTQAWK